MSAGAATLASRIAVRARTPVGMGLAGKLAEAVALCVFVTVLPRVLGPEDFGRLALAVAVVQIAGATMSFGGPVTLSRFIAAHPGPEQRSLARLLVTRMAAWRALILAGAAVLAVAAAIVAPDRMPPAMAALLVTAITFEGVATLFAQAGLGLGVPALWSYRIPVQTSVLIVAALTLIPPFGAWGAAAAVVVAAGVVAAIVVVIVAPRFHGVRRADRMPDGVGRFAVLQAMTGFLLLCVARGGVVAVAWLHPSAEAVGYIGLAAGVALGGVYAVGQAFTLQLPSLSAQAASDPAGAEARGRRLARAGVLVVAPATVVAAAVVPLLLVPIAGERFAAAAPVIVLAIAMVPFAPVTALVMQTAALRLRPEVALATSGTGAAVFALVALTTTAHFGAPGAAAAMAAGTAAAALAGSLLMRDTVPGRLLAVSVAGALAVVALAAVA